MLTVEVSAVAAHNSAFLLLRLLDIFKRAREIKLEPLNEKTSNFGFRPGPTKTGLYSHRKGLEA